MFGWFHRKSLPTSGPDFSSVDSLAKAEALQKQGQLEKLFLMPLEFGGEENPLNTLYVPLGVAGVKSSIDNNVIGPLAEAGKVATYTATPRYQGKSHVPTAILIVASGETEFRQEISIWGNAISGGQEE